MEEIRFAPGDETMSALHTVFWDTGDSKSIVFFPDSPVQVSVISSGDPDLAARLAAFADASPMSIDLEWKPDRKIEANPISLFQFGSSKGILIVLNDGAGIDVLKSFIADHIFFGKGMSYDHAKLHALFGQTFPIEDIQLSRIIPNDLPVNFSDLVSTVLGEPSAQFKDKTVTCSNWTQRPLTVQQVIYAAFDAYAVYQVYHAVLTRFGGPEYIPTDIAMKRKTRGSTTKKETGRGRSVPQMIKRIKPKFDPTVKFVDLSAFSAFIQFREEAEFRPRPRYSPRQSLLEYLTAYGEMELRDGQFYCNLCSVDVPQADDHAWMFHFDHIAGVYFPDQSPRYLELTLRQVHLAHITCESDSPSHVKCTLCDRHFQSFHSFFRHSRLMHAAEVTDSNRTDPRDLVVEYFSRVEHIQAPVCPLCNLDCGTAEAFRAHCWEAHGERLAPMLKHRPLNYRDETFTDAFALGVRALDTVHAGQIWHGSICCGICKIGFDDPGELFVHLFHRHTKLCAVSAAQAEGWPLKACDLVTEMREVLARLCSDGAIAALKGAGVFEENACVECGVQFTEEASAWQHALERHLAVVF